MRVAEFMDIVDADFYTGVPDSLLQPLSNTLMARWGQDPRHHVIGANEGCCAALAAGYHLATGKTAAVYLQNSGEGNLVNPVASLLNEAVYAIPCLLIVGWRGEPGVHDEPQHVFQGRITRTLLDTLEIPSFVVSAETTGEELRQAMAGFRERFAQGKQAALVIRKGALTDGTPMTYRNSNPLSREEIIRRITEAAGDDLIVSTTGKASRELYELREAAGSGHERDFLTVGSMGHASMIALGVALQRRERRVWCLDGDGAALMHMGALATIGSLKPDNLVHVVIHNGAHESVGGLPTTGSGVSVARVAADCGYPAVHETVTAEELEAALEAIRRERVCAMLEAHAAIGARADLGRPAGTARGNKEALMNWLG